MLQANEFKIYNASAGSGKTYTLVKEYISLLLANPNPMAFESILAITFTNKAANEMKQRILDWLKNFSKDDYAKQQDIHTLSTELNLPIEEIHLRSKKILTKIIHNYSCFSVSTIDKFNLRLMRSFSKDLGLSGNFEVEMYAEQLLEEATGVLFSKIGEDDNLTDILIEIALYNLDNNRSWDISRELIQNTKELLSDRHAQPMQEVKKVSLNEFNDFRKEVFKKVISYEKQLKKIGEDALNLIKDNGIDVGKLAGGNRGGIHKYFDKLKDETFKFPNKTNIKNIEEENYAITKATASDIAQIKAIFPQIKDYFYKSVNLLSEYHVWLKIRGTVSSLCVMSEIEKSLDTIKEENNILLISEFNSLISKHLQKQPSGFIYERMGNRFHHYFIDEFQDTSTLQWKNMEPLIENARATSDTIMLVGDAKQSIYRWRGGNPELMIDLVENKLEYNIHEENLKKNWRSHEEIIKFNNEFYTYISQFLNNDSYKKLYLEGNNQEINSKEGGYVQFNFFEKAINQTEYRENQLNQILKNIHLAQSQGFDLSEIAILTRKKRQGKLIAEFLKENQIKVISNESLLIISSPEIILLEHFFELLENEKNLDAKTNFLLLLHELNKLETPDLTATISHLLPQNKKDFVQSLKDYNIDLEFILEPSASFYDFTESCIRSLSLGQNGSIYIVSFLNYVLEYSEKYEFDFGRFLEFWDKKRDTAGVSSPADANSVNLMTIHKSKGLEFPVVILPFADWSIKSDDFWIPIEDENSPFSKFFVTSHSNLENTNEGVAKEVEKELNSSQLDDINILYVATTRAVEQLYIISQSPPKKNSESNSISKYIRNYAKNLGLNPEGEIVVKGKLGRNSIPEEQIHSLEEIPFVSTDWNNRVFINKKSENRWKSSASIVYGELIHELLKSIYSEKDIEPILNQSLIQGIIQQEELIPIKEKILSIVLHPKLEKYFSEEGISLNERDLIDSHGEIFRPDKIVLDDDKNCTIIDYKTGEPKETHKTQLENYAEVLRQIGYDISKLILVYIHQEIIVEEV